MHILAKSFNANQGLRLADGVADGVGSSANRAPNLVLPPLERLALEITFSRFAPRMVSCFGQYHRQGEVRALFPYRFAHEASLTAQRRFAWTQQVEIFVASSRKAPHLLGSRGSRSSRRLADRRQCRR